MSFKRLFFVVFFFALPFALFSQGKISGYMFGDYYTVLEHRDENVDGQNGFWFRRIYFTYDHKFDEKFSTRLRLELNSPGDFKTKETLKPYVKDAYLNMKMKDHNALFGISPSPTWEYIENFWGYRSVEKTPADLYKHSSSRDFGIAFKGKLAKNFSYHLLIGNGEGISSEVNEEKKVYLSLLYSSGPFSFEIYGDYAQGDDNTDSNMLQGFLGIKKEKFKFGLQYYKYNKGQGEGKDDLKNDVASMFLNLNLSDKTVMLFRVDKSMDPNPGIGSQSYTPFDKNHPFFLYLLGIDFKVMKNLSIIPNLTFVKYEEYNGTTPDDDFYGKITFYYSWSQ